MENPSRESDFGRKIARHFHANADLGDDGGGPSHESLLKSAALGSALLFSYPGELAPALSRRLFTIARRAWPWDFFPF